MEKKAFVGNAADPAQVKAAEKRERREANDDVKDLKKILATPEGIRFVWRVMAKCKTFGEAYAPGELKVYNMGQQAIGRWLMSECVLADKSAMTKILVQHQETFVEGEH